MFINPNYIYEFKGIYLLKVMKTFEFKKTTQGQSFIELAIILPILLLMLVGLVEVAIFLGRYMDVLDLSREAARFASLRDPKATSGDLDCKTSDDLNFFYDTACTISPPAGTDGCNSYFCNGMNAYIGLDVFNDDGSATDTTDDVVISVFTVDDETVTQDYPYWALSNVNVGTQVDNNFSGTRTDNFTKDCQGNVVRSEPYFTVSRISSSIDDDAPTAKGYVAVEVYYCYHQILGMPVIADYLPNPIQIHTYTIMPLPAAKPTS
jgi:Flp pilus assembly protein TadG